MSNIISVIAFLSILAATATAQPVVKNTEGIITGDYVRVREQPHLKAKIITRVHTGQVVTINNKTDKRMSLKEGTYGYFWYHITVTSKKSGWIYGQFLYFISGKDFISNNADIKSIVLNKIQYTFGCAVEPAYPVADEGGLTGSTVHALPYFMLQGARKALPLTYSSHVHIINREQKGKNVLFKLASNEGQHEQIFAVKPVVWGKRRAVEITISISLQDRSGSYRLIAIPAKESFIIVNYMLLKMSGDMP